MKMIKNRSGYTIVIVLMIIGFLMILTVGVFNLVLRELSDNRGMGSQIKAYAGAEAGQELALLEIKKKGYGYYKKVNFGDEISKILHTGENIKNDVNISYDLASKVNKYTGTLGSGEYHIIPLFYIDDTGEQKISNFNLNIPELFDSITWNILSENSGISGVGNINASSVGYKKTVEGQNLKYSTDTIGNFLHAAGNTNNYLILFNSHASLIGNYELTTVSGDEFFTKPVTYIISSAQVGDYKQNLSTKLDNTEFLSILKYSIFSD